MGKIDLAIEWMESTAKDDQHGYCQTHRWGEDGDYDCSGAVITAWEISGVPVKTKGASYTGNIYTVFRSCGFEDVTNIVNLKTGSGLKRGDVLLKPGAHVAMFCGNRKIVDACINEKGTITGGKPGDQTGKEFWIHSYYNYPWKYVLRYKEGAGSFQNITSEENIVKFFYSVKTEAGKIYDEVENLKDYAGKIGEAITGISIRCDNGSVKYQVHTVGGDWSDWTIQGFAGDGEKIDAVRVYYNTPNDIVIKHGYQKAQYRVSPVNQKYYDWQYDDETGNGQDGYAGCFGKAIDRFQLC